MLQKRYKRSRHGERGQAVIEATLMAPWLMLLFLGVFNVGFYAYSLTSIENALRVATHRASTSASAAVSGQTPCNAMVAEMRALPNVNVLDCGAPGVCVDNFGGGQTCTAGPLVLTTVSLTAGASPDQRSAAVRLTVRYDTVPLFPFPGFSGKFRFTRIAEMKIRSNI